MKAKQQQVILAGLERRLPVLRPASAAAAKPARGWINAVRTACGLSQRDVARRLARAQQAVAIAEKAEEREAISLQTLRRAAEAMDCELVYFIVPRGAKSYADLASKNDPRMKHLRASEQSMALEDQAVGDLPTKLL